MGTRSITAFIDEDGEEFCTVYKQYDGYPEGLGKDMAETLEHKTLVNGFNNRGAQLNGMGCLAAYVVSKIKDGCGNVYIKKTGARDCWEDFLYTIRPGVEKGDAWKSSHEIEIAVASVGGGYDDEPRKEKELFRGTPQEYLAWLKEGEEQEDA